MNKYEALAVLKDHSDRAVDEYGTTVEGGEAHMRQEFIDALSALGVTDVEMMAAGVVHP